MQRVLAQNEALVSGHNQYLEDQCQRLAAVLVKFLPAGQKTNFRLDRLLKIFEEASDLAHEMRLSPRSYAFDIAFRFSASNRDRVLFYGDMAKYRIINTATCQALRKSDLVAVAQDGRIGEKLCVVHPALVLRRGIEQGNIVLTKATILARLDYPVNRPQQTNT